MKKGRHKKHKKEEEDETSKTYMYTVYTDMYILNTDFQFRYVFHDCVIVCVSSCCPLGSGGHH